MPAPGKGVDKSKKKTIIKSRKKYIKRRHAERAARRVSASHLVSILKSGEIPDQVRDDGID